ncbi:hypothetical protein EB796_021285 [Bugula neritina]|uniref:C-type lectin domain-containing protein n=1 Tax=Bugula neritina TaxID=10212 RepID=A0A7J7J2V3_BUGNE|nr:hypothetical protein EB796_021285 [Bugula neritina]
MPTMLFVTDKLFIEWTPYINKDLWIGGRKYLGGWQWMDNFGRLVMVEDWFIGQPDNREGSENCLAFSASYNQDLRWSDKTCTYSYYFICEKY